MIKRFIYMFRTKNNITLFCYSYNTLYNTQSINQQTFRRKLFYIHNLQLLTHLNCLPLSEQLTFQYVQPRIRYFFANNRLAFWLFK
jgi:hypothetical protein